MTTHLIKLNTGEQYTLPLNKKVKLLEDANSRLNQQMEIA